MLQPAKRRFIGQRPAISPCFISHWLAPQPDRNMKTPLRPYRFDFRHQLTRRMLRRAQRTRIAGSLFALLVAGPAWLPLAAPAQQPVGTVVSRGLEVLPLVQPSTCFTSVAAGNFYSLALKCDGTPVAWGNNVSRQSTVPSGLSGVSALAAGGQFVVALKQDKTVIQWGEPPGWLPGGLGGVIAVAAGQNHGVALKQDGTLVAWGFNSDGQVVVPGDLGTVTNIAAGA